MSQLERAYFGTDGIRGPANVPPLTPDFAVRLGRTAADLFLERRDGGEREWPTVIIGKDTRQSCDMLEAAVAAGIASLGVDVRLAGVIPTPAVARLVVEERALFGVVISASHNPFSDNGIKFFGPDGFKLDDALEREIESRLERMAVPSSDDPAGPVGRIAPLPRALERYVSFVREGAGGDPDLLSGLTIALDCANGASHESSEAVLRSLGAKVIARHNQPSGLNINEECGCTHPGIIERLVKESGADVGISHDGDADRVLLCDETGSVVDGDELMAIAAIGLLERGELPGDTLVATVMSNAGLDEAVNAAGGKVVRTAVGDRYVLEAMREHGYVLGGEQSGHFIFLRQNTTGDGIVAAVQLLRILREKGEPLSRLRRAMTRFPQVQRNVRVSRKPELDSLAVSEQIRRAESELGESGRVLLRYSGTEPKLRILVEGKDESRINGLADELAAAVRGEIGA